MICFYHNDMDGRCAGSLIARFTGNYNSSDFQEIDYRKPFPLNEIDVGEDVYIVDYSFTTDTVNVLKELIKLNCNITWIDHHQSSIDLTNNPAYQWINNIPGIRNDSLSGAALTYQYFKKVPIYDLPTYIKYVDDYDRWIFRLGDDTTYFKPGLETNAYDALDTIWIELYNESIYDNQEKSDKMGCIKSIIETGKIIKTYIEKENALYLKNYGYKSKILKYDCYVVNKSTNSWIFGDKIKKYPIVIVWVYDGKRYNYSIYSSYKSINCSKLAEHYGGGGHKGAAGFSSNKMLFSKIG